MCVIYVRRDFSMTAKEQAQEIAREMKNVKHIVADENSLTVYTHWKED